MLALEDHLVKIRGARGLVWRIAYVAWCVGISAYSLGSFVRIIQPYVAINYSYRTEGIVVVAQVAFQWLFMLRSSWQARVRYMYVALTVSMLGSLMLLPLLFAHSLVGASGVIAIVYFFAVVGIIFVIHHRLIVRNALPKILSCTWVLYRLLLLGFVLFPTITALSTK